MSIRVLCETSKKALRVWRRERCAKTPRPARIRDVSLLRVILNVCSPIVLAFARFRRAKYRNDQNDPIAVLCHSKQQTFSCTMTLLSQGLLAVATAMLVTSVAAIYPDDLWQRSTKVTSQENFDETIQQAIDGDGTLFVRWIASEG